jgi:hypothetical protein
MGENVNPTGTYVWSIDFSVNYLSHVGSIFTKSWSKVLALKALGLVTCLKSYPYNTGARGSVVG